MDPTTTGTAAAISAVVGATMVIGSPSQPGVQRKQSAPSPSRPPIAPHPEILCGDPLSAHEYRDTRNRQHHHRVGGPTDGKRVHPPRATEPPKKSPAPYVIEHSSARKMAMERAILDPPRVVSRAAPVVRSPTMKWQT